MATIIWKVAQGPGLEMLWKALSEPNVLVRHPKFDQAISLPRWVHITVNEPYDDTLLITVRGLKNLSLDVQDPEEPHDLWEVTGNLFIDESLTIYEDISERMVGKILPFVMRYNPHNRKGNFSFNIPD